MVKDFSYIFSFPFIFAALCIFVVSQYVLARHKARGAWYLFFACLAASFWSVSEGMLYLDLNHGSKILLTKCQYFGIAPILPLTLLFVLTVFGIRSRMIGFLRWVLIAIISLIIILVWTNPLHQLVFTGYYTINTGAVEMLGLHHGLLWWIIITYHYFLVTIISVILLKISYTASGFERAQALVILAAVASVWIANAIYISGHSPVQNMDISPIALSLVAGSMAWGFFRYNLLDILPVAKTEVFKGMDDAILVFDERNRIVDFNTAAEAIIRTEVSEDTVKQTQQVFKKFPMLQRIIEHMRRSEVLIRVDGQKNIYDVRVSKLPGRDGTTAGRIMVLRDITARKRAIEAILESEEKFKFLAENMGDIVWTLDMDFNTIYISPSVEKVLGFTPEECKRQKLEETVTPESLERITAIYPEELQLNAVKDTESDLSPTIEVEYYHRNGSIVWLENKVKALRDATGTIVGMYGVSRDITERKRMEQALKESEEKNRTILESIKGFLENDA
jgi:PAS domain S-box-containing protein